MANKEVLEILKQGVEVWNKWRRENPDVTPDLTGANLNNSNLAGANLCKADLRWVKLCGADLHGTRLFRANLVGARLVGANLAGTDLSMADLYEANLREVDLREADLSLVCLVRTDLNHANLTGAHLYGVSRDNWNISGVTCDWIYWDEEKENRVPKDRHFRSGEFEELYKDARSIEKVLSRIGNLKGELFELVIDKVLQCIFPRASIERKRILREKTRGTLQFYEYDHIIYDRDRKEIIVVEAKSHYQEKQILLGDSDTKETVRWFFEKAFPFAKKYLSDDRSSVKACYITWANFTEDAEEYLKKLNTGRLKSTQLDVFYNNEKLRELLDKEALYEEIKVLEQHLKKVIEFVR
jgi:hypothetical protein